MMVWGCISTWGVGCLSKIKGMVYGPVWDYTLIPTVDMLEITDR